MFKKIDAYIIKRYLMTFFVMLLLFIPIGIMVDVAEKIDKFKENEVPISEIVSYYINYLLVVVIVKLALLLLHKNSLLSTLSLELMLLNYMCFVFVIIVIYKHF